MDKDKSNEKPHDSTMLRSYSLMPVAIFSSDVLPWSACQTVAIRHHYTFENTKFPERDLLLPGGSDRRAQTEPAFLPAA
jgi:hypothetical protein